MKLLIIGIILFSLNLSSASCITPISDNLLKPTKYIWGWNHIFACNHYHPCWREARPELQCEYYSKHYYKIEEENFSSIKPGHTIFIPNFAITDFIKIILPTINVPFILVTAWGDSGVGNAWLPEPNKYGAQWITNDQQLIKKLLDDKRLIHWFTHNYDLSFNHEKITILPLGLNYHSEILWNTKQAHEKSSHEQEKILENIVCQAQPTHKRIKMIYADFHLSDTLSLNNTLVTECGYSRTSLKYQLEKMPFVFIQKPRLSRTELWERKAKFAFSISPHGNGLDCHRTWEDLILGCIVIVKTSPLDPLYIGLPVVIVNDWKELTEENLTKWLKQYGNAFTNPSYREKLTSTYWTNKIKEKQYNWIQENIIRKEYNNRLATMHKKMRQRKKHLMQ